MKTIYLYKHYWFNELPSIPLRIVHKDNIFYIENNKLSNILGPSIIYRKPKNIECYFINGKMYDNIPNKEYWIKYCKLKAFE